VHQEFMTPGSIPRPHSGRVLGRAICVCVLAFAICSIAPPVVVAQPSGDVPGMDYYAADGVPCGRRGTYVFGRDQTGALLACHWNNPAKAFTWDGPLSGPLEGVQREGTGCTTYGASIAYAQTPDGYPLSCQWGQWGRI